MAIKGVEASINVVEAAKQRIRNLFESGRNIYFAFSSGKDSLCVSSLLLDLIKSGDIDPKQLIVIFIDEELVYQSMVDAAYRWKAKFEAVGSLFLWFCLPFKQNSVVDGLSNNESWITWDPSCKELWTRQPPEFAIVHSDILNYAGEMNYQAFCEKACADGYQLVGIRMAESFVRIKMATEARIESSKKAYPIYDWRDTDVWRYIRDHKLEFPDTYMKMYEAGTPKNRLRLCAFFGEGGSAGLPIVSEIDPDQWDRICKREPNAQLALLYWDSEMFGRKTKTRKELEGDTGKDYKAMLEDLLFYNTDKYNIGRDTIETIPYYRKMYEKSYYAMDAGLCKRMYEWIVFGDPKHRGLRTMPIAIYSKYTDRCKREDGGHGKTN